MKQFAIPFFLIALYANCLNAQDSIAFISYNLTGGGVSDSTPVFTVSKGAYNEIGSVVFPVKMNVFYIGVDNPVDISVPGVLAKDVSATLIGDGAVTKVSDGKFVVTVTLPSKVLVGVMVKGKEVSRIPFRCKRIPDPVATVGGRLRGGEVGREALMAQVGIVAILENFDFDARFTTNSFTMTATLGSASRTLTATGPMFTAEMKNVLSQLKTGDMVVINDVIVTGPDLQSRRLQPIVLKIL